jgi:uncharacterized membrane protein
VSLDSIPLVLTLLLMGASCHFIPRSTRPNLFFGVTVDRDFPRSEDGRRLLWRHTVGVWCSTAVAVAAAIADIQPLFVLLLFLTGMGISFIVAYRSALRYRTIPSAVVEIDMTVPPERIPGGAVVLLLPFALLVCLGLWVLSPAHPLGGDLITHWAATGPDHWVRATPRAVLVRLARAGFWCLIFVVLALGIMHGSRRVSAAGPAVATERRFRRRVAQFILLCEYFVVLLALLNVTQAPRFIFLGVSVGFAMILATLVVSLVRMGQGGSRLSTQAMMPVGDRLRDEFWKWGVFYFNRRDRAVFVERRTGVGYTLNFGSVWSWVLLGTIIAFLQFLHYMARG